MLDQKEVVEGIRKIFYQVLINNSPEKFQNRLKECRKFSQNLQLQFSSMDTIYQIEDSLKMFFVETIRGSIES